MKLSNTRPKKLVRIDDRTVIEVDADIPDQVARDKYIERHGQGLFPST